MKIGILVWDLGIMGGTQRQALELAVHLQKLGENIIVYTNKLIKDKCYQRIIEQLTIRSLNGENNKSSLAKIKRAFSKYPEECMEFAKLIDSDIDILNPHDQEVYIVARIHKEMYNTPVVWMMNDLPYRGSDLSAFGRILKQITGFDTFLNRQTRKNIRDFDKIIVLDNRNKQIVKRILGKEAEVVRTGLDINTFKFRNKEIDLKNIRIFSNGVIYPHRRTEDTIEALSILRNKGYCVSLDYVGTDAKASEYALKLYRLVDRLSLNKYISFHGAVREEELAEFYQGTDFFVFPNAPQTWGLAVFEAMASGVPTIVSKGCGASEVLTHMENTLLVEPKKPEQIAQSVITLIENKNLREEIVNHGRSFVEGNIRWDLFAHNILKIMRDVKK